MSVNGFGPHQRVGCAICTPVPAVKLANGEVILDTITVEWHRRRTAIATPTNFNVCEIFADGLEVGVARTQVARRCLAMDPRPEYILWLDYDVLPDFDALTKLHFRAQCYPDYDVFAGVYCLKGHNPPEPLVYAGEGAGPFWDWAVGDLLTTDGHGISSVHMGLTLIRVSLFQRLLDAGIANEKTPLFYSANDRERVNGALKTRRGTEDIWFCQLARQLGAKIMVDTSVLAGHIDKHTGVTWGLAENTPPVQRAKWLTQQDRKEADADGLKLALDLGAGGRKRTWAGHRTYTTDLRPESKPDYVMDTRLLNFPPDHWDLVASSHHLEHLGRWDQEMVWREVFRVTKPGGAVEMIVPSVDWAAQKIANNQVDGHVLNVLMGAQESHGYQRELNTHFMAYTKRIGKALAEQAGFIEVTVEDWRDDPNHGYELVIRGKKPAPEPAEIPQEPPPPAAENSPQALEPVEA